LTALHQAASRLAILTCSGRLWNRCCTESTFTSQITSLYVDCQEQVATTYRDQEMWTECRFSTWLAWANSLSDRTIQEYCQEIWKAEPVKIDLEAYRQEAAGLKVKDPVLT